MRTLAIIPACEGSATLPNKNMRVLHGKPMIYYAINNALCSKYITDAIVTSNSNEIISMARRMGVMTRKRAHELCNSHVSLDRVVWDVFEQLSLADYDVVVTMQSISPTLHVNTLDAAFAEFFEKAYDTVISVKIQQQFYWQISDGVPHPIQKKRMNRHQLPPLYIETGAFLITKSAFIKEDNRLGQRIGLYELAGDEAIDVNSFGELKQAENALSRQSTAIYVNGNAQIGMGHISRMFQVADELFTKPDFFYNRSITNPKSFGETTYSLHPIEDDDGFAAAVKRGNYDIIINDVLNTSEAFMLKLRNSVPNARIINFEDEGDGAKYADVVINALYEKAQGINAICGSRYFILSKQFLLYDAINIENKVRRVVVTFGGADPQNYTEMLLKCATRPDYRDISFCVVLGKANTRHDALLSYQKYDNVTILHDIDNMAEIMSGCDAAVTSRGRTCFELAALGIPTLSIAQHEREERHQFVCGENGFLCLPPTTDEANVEACFRQLIYSDEETRKQWQRKMLETNLRNGRKNVAEIIYAVK